MSLEGVKFPVNVAVELHHLRARATRYLAAAQVWRTVAHAGTCCMLLAALFRNAPPVAIWFFFAGAVLAGGAMAFSLFLRVRAGMCMRRGDQLLATMIDHP